MNNITSTCPAEYALSFDIRLPSLQVKQSTCGTFPLKQSPCHGGSIIYICPYVNHRAHKGSISQPRLFLTPFKILRPTVLYFPSHPLKSQGIHKHHKLRYYSQANDIAIIPAHMHSGSLVSTETKPPLLSYKQATQQPHVSYQSQGTQNSHEAQ
jgi:hypothetical protein